MNPTTVKHELIWQDVSLNHILKTYADSFSFGGGWTPEEINWLVDPARATVVYRILVRRTVDRPPMHGTSGPFKRHPIRRKKKK